MGKFSAFKDKTVIVLGDVMLDRYIFGESERISDEAPVPIVRVDKEKFVPGGAGNVAMNISSLGGRAILIGATGNDEAGDILKKELKARNIIFYNFSNRTTNQKIRVLARGQQLVRVDYESFKNPLSSPSLQKFKQLLFQKMSEADIIVISDYAKGVISNHTASLILQYSQQRKIHAIVDTKPNHVTFFKDAYLFTPNSKEAAAMSGSDNTMNAGRILQKKLQSNILITEGSHGMTLFEGNSVTHLPTKAREVFDVTGAGDTVVAALALAIASKMTLQDAAEIANHAAGIVVGKVGTATVSIKELQESFI